MPHDVNLVRQHTNAFAETKIDKTPDAEKIITVEIAEKTGCVLDGDRVMCGMTVKVSIQQWRALSRHLKFIDGPADHAPEGWTAPSTSPAAS
ncbi:MAG TPA: hypothetical protein VH619_05065 [Verrucomicrobiae bacterium]|jgi:hypothetical protein|nr:hypothetical protein [Verrucomicrobiae bacterium]